MQKHVEAAVERLKLKDLQDLEAEIKIVDTDSTKQRKWKNHVSEPLTIRSSITR